MFFLRRVFYISLLVWESVAYFLMFPFIDHLHTKGDKKASDFFVFQSKRLSSVQNGFPTDVWRRFIRECNWEHHLWGYKKIRTVQRESELWWSCDRGPANSASSGAGMTSETCLAFVHQHQQMEAAIRKRVSLGVISIRVIPGEEFNCEPSTANMI